MPELELEGAELSRLYVGELRVRAGGDGAERILEGRAVPFGEIVTVRDTPGGRKYRETIAPGATAGIDPTDVRLEALFASPSADYNTHSGAVLIGRGVELLEGDGGGLDMAFRVSRTAAGDDALELARDGVLSGLSVVFAAGEQHERRDGVVERTRINVRRVALVERGAYQGATVSAVRAAMEGDMPETAAAATADPTTEAARAATITISRGELDELIATTVDRALETERAGAERATAARFGAAARVTRPELLYGPGSGRSYFGDLFRLSPLGAMSEPAGFDMGAARDRVTKHQRFLADVDQLIQRGVADELARAVAAEAAGETYRAGDVLSSEIPGAYPNQYLPGLFVPRVLKGRPMGGFYQRFPITDGTPKIYPVASTSTTVAAQGAEGSNPAASDFATTATTLNPVFYGGETKVSRQVLDGADPNTDVMISTDLNEAYVQASEAVIRAAVEAGSTASGVTLTAATPQTGLVNLILNYLGNVFVPAEGLFLPLTTLYGSWATQADTTGRLLASFLSGAFQQFNSVGSITAPGMPAGVLEGVPIIPSWSSTAGAGAGVGGVAVVGRPSDFAILESNLATFQFTQGAEAPSAIRVGLWAYLVVGTRRGSRKATGA